MAGGVELHWNIMVKWRSVVVVPWLYYCGCTTVVVPLWLYYCGCTTVVVLLFS